MIKDKKWVSVVLALGMMTLLIVGCGKDESRTNKETDKKTTITYALWDDSQAKGMKEIANAFMKENPEITVKVESTPWDQYWTKLEAGATGKNMPDVFWMHGNDAERYMSNGALMDLTDSVEASKFPDDIVKMYSYEGKTYGVPKDLTSIGLFYNKKIFDDAGIPYPDETWDWEKLRTVAKELTNSEKGIYGFGAGNANEAGYYSFIYQNDGSVLSQDKKSSTIDDPNTQSALQWWLDFSLKDHSSPTNAQFSENGMESYFVSGRLAMGTFGSWQVASFMENDYVKEHADVALLPKGKNRTTIYNGLANVASAYTKNEAATKKFMKYLGSKEANQIQSESGAAIPAYQDTAEGWVNKTKEYFNTQIFVEMLETKVLRPNGPNFQKAEKYQTEQLAKLFDGDSSVKVLTEKIAPEITKILNE